jgi:tetratricopeptide (TPR) repeat protein
MLLRAFRVQRLSSLRSQCKSYLFALTNSRLMRFPLSQTTHLIDAIEKQGESNVVWKALQTIGYTAKKLRDQKVKVWRILAKSEMKRQNFEEAISYLKQALAISDSENTTKDLNELLNDVTKKLGQVKKKEKSMWQNAFKKRSEQPAADDEISSSVPSPKSIRSLAETSKPETPKAVNFASSSSNATTIVGEDGKTFDLDAEFAKKFNVPNNNSVSKKKKPTPSSTENATTTNKDSQVAKPSFWNSGRFYFAVTGFIGLATLGYFVTRRKF